MNHDFFEIQKAIFAKRPALKVISEKYGKLSLADYVKTAWRTPNQPPEEGFLAVVFELAEKLFDTETAAKVQSQLRLKPMVSTIDHHGIWNHPVFVNSALIYSLSHKPEDLAIVFSTESVSLNNSCWSGSLFYHQAGQRLVRESFFPDRQKTKAVIAAPPILNADIIRILARAKPELGEFIKNLVIAPAGSFSEQASVMSRKIWNVVFPSAPTLIYLPLETLTARYLIRQLSDTQSFFFKLLATVGGRDLWRNFFPQEHTFMFWRLDEKGRRHSVGEFSMTAGELIDALQQKKIYPSSTLCFMVLLYSGFECVGGFNQTTWLANIKDNFLKLMESAGVKEGEQIKKISTQNFAETSLAWMKMGNGFVQPSAVDLFFSGMDYYQHYKQVANSLTVEESLNLALPSIYSIVVPKPEQVQDFDQANLEQSIFKDSPIARYLTEI